MVPSYLFGTTLIFILVPRCIVLSIHCGPLCVDSMRHSIF
jgi:hypothetical protein